MKLISLLKHLPIDLGQGTLRKTTKGKEIAFDVIPHSKNLRALDVGCREGTQTRRLKEKGYRVTSIDIDKAYENAQIVDINEGLPFEDNFFELIWCSEVIEHLENPQKSVNEFRRVLKPGGLLVVTTPNSYCWISQLLSVFGFTPKKIQNPNHKHFFGINDIRSMFPSAEIWGFFPYAIIKIAINRFIGRLSPTFVIIERLPP